jgi:hypothetical protein
MNHLHWHSSICFTSRTVPFIKLICTFLVRVVRLLRAIIVVAV